MPASVPSFFTTSWHVPLLTVFGIRSVRRPSMGSILSLSIILVGSFGFVSSSISRARSSSDLTPSAMHIRFMEPYRLIATGMSEPVGFSNSSAGPPPGDFETRSVTAAISRSGLTGSAIRMSSRSRSSASIKAFRSLNISASSNRLHLVSNRLRQRQRAEAIFTRNQRPARVAHRAHEIHEFALQRLFARHGQLAALDLRTFTVAAHQPVALDLLLGIVDRHVRV